MSTDLSTMPAASADPPVLEPIGTWRPGGAQGAGAVRPEVTDFLAAVRIFESRRGRGQIAMWDLAVVRFELDDRQRLECDAAPWGWEWQDVDWWRPVDAEIAELDRLEARLGTPQARGETCGLAAKDSAAPTS